jgi:hypothetical protein
LLLGGVYLLFGHAHRRRAQKAVEQLISADMMSPPERTELPSVVFSMCTVPLISGG